MASEPEETVNPATTRALDPSTHQQVCQQLHQASVQSCDLLPRGSNYTFLVKLILKNQKTSLGIYKPSRGEAPLWDFPHGTLFKRECAAYLLSEALGWGFVPPTVVWEGPYGTGSLQLFIESEPKITYFELRKIHPREVQRIAAFDLLANNADRKGGHCVRDLNGKVWSIDHGLTFNLDYKLRTVIWDFAGQTMAKDIVEGVAAVLARLHLPGGLAHSLQGLLSRDEIDTLAGRMDSLLRNPVFPHPQGRWDFPWPMV